MIPQPSREGIGRKNACEQDTKKTAEWLGRGPGSEIGPIAKKKSVS